MTSLPRASLCGFVMTSLAGLTLRSPAQDVTVAPIAWVDTQDVPDTPPVPVRAIKPGFPHDLKKTTDIGWAAVNLFVDDHGKVLTWSVDATQPAYAQAIEEAHERKKFQPGRRAGQAVNSRVRFSVLFNPLSASPTSPDATPRLLDANVIVDPSLRTGKHQPPGHPRIVWATVNLDAGGHVLAVRDEPEGLHDVLDRAVRTWRFAAARKGGVAVASDVRVPFVMVSGETIPGKNVQPPRWLRRVPPVYPLALRRSGLRGNVTVEFVVNIEGRVQDPVIVSSLNPAFNEPAIEAVRKWTFEPGRSDGVPMNTKLRQSIEFALNLPDGGNDGFEVTHRGNQKKLPAELRYDVAPKPKAFVPPVYPYALLRDDVSGEATVGLLIDDGGRVALATVNKSSRPELGYALQAAAEYFEYAPALKDARPTQALVGFDQDFSPQRAELVSVEDRTLLRLEEKHPERILKNGDLDSRIKPKITPAPRFPSTLVNETVPGEAVVEFLIDEDGAVHLPRVVSSTKPEFGYAAVQAVSRWRFEPPRSKGKPGVTRVRVPMTFRLPEAAASAATVSAAH
jgi:TonB family protein